MKLIGTHASPYVRKVRVLVVEKKVDCEFVLGDVMAPDSPIFEVNPLGKIPVLVLDDGESLYDSKVIVEYLDSFSNGPSLIPADARKKATVRCWEALADGALDSGILARWEAVQREPQYRDPAWVARQMKKINMALKAMSEGLADKPFCTGESFSLADAAVGCALGWFRFRFPEIQWQRQYPNLAGLFERLSERPSFSTTEPRA
ncbi:MAG: glutathione S-transferase N-terminal domain-containing protein [Burkholderiaceae bacterium]|nr:glutathione S-transferase N-terminal domain-containing protein [Burkholderiaceae bacterium]